MLKLPNFDKLMVSLKCVIFKNPKKGEFKTS